jgi:DNA-binding CsgD family transcriptional regulator
MRSPPQASSCLAFLEAAYAWELDDRAWFNGLATAAVAVWGRPHWTCAYEYDVSDTESPHIGKPTFWGTPRPVQKLLTKRLQVRGLTPEVRHLYRTVTMGFGTPAGGVDEEDKRALAQAQSSDYFVLNGLDGSGKGCAVGIGAERVELTSGEILVLQHMAAHLASAYRCRVRLRQAKSKAVDESEAILRPDGRVLDAKGPAQPSRAREALHDAVRAMEKVRHRRRFSDLPTGHWHPRIRTRWTLVDGPADETQRYLLARENQIQPAGLQLLTERERQVVACLAAGRTTKEIAYELGISNATTRVLLTRAYARLGVNSREELFKLKSIRALRGETVR